MSDDNEPQLLPDVDDPVAAPFWSAAREGRLVVQRCDGCGALRWPPLVGCPDCRSREATWIVAATTGVVWSYATYHRALHRAFAADVPYSIAVVDVDGGPRITARVADPDDRLRVGAPVVVSFERITDEITIPRWTLV